MNISEATLGPVMDRNSWEVSLVDQNFSLGSGSGLQGTGNKFYVILHRVVSNKLALAILNPVGQHGDYFSCRVCTENGASLSCPLVFPADNDNPRTDENFRS